MSIPLKQKNLLEHQLHLITVGLFAVVEVGCWGCWCTREEVLAHIQTQPQQSQGYIMVFEERGLEMHLSCAC